MKEPASIEHIRSLYLEEMWPGSRIAKHFGVTRQAIYERMRREGFAYRPRGRKSAVIPKIEAERLYVLEGLTIAEIARRLDLSWSVVAHTLDVHGIERRNNRAKVIPSWIQSLRVGDNVEIETDGRYAYYIYANARKLNIRVVVRRVSEKRFAIIRTPLLTRDLVKALRDTGLSIREIAFTFRVDEKRIRKMLSQGC